MIGPGHAEYQKVQRETLKSEADASLADMIYIEKA
jgi:hypothetical protein